MTRFNIVTYCNVEQMGSTQYHQNKDNTNRDHNKQLPLYISKDNFITLGLRETDNNHLMIVTSIQYRWLLKC
jgi:hypothetical protein